jgi:hypothetical protein
MTATPAGHDPNHPTLPQPLAPTPPRTPPNPPTPPPTPPPPQKPPIRFESKSTPLDTTHPPQSCFPSSA